MTSQRALDLLLELQTLDRVDRSGYALRGIADPESVAEHTFHLVFLVWLLAAREPEVDRARAMELALIHDLPEVRTGDLPRPVAHHWPAGTKLAAERAILASIFPPDHDEASARLVEYQAGETPESRFVRDCDKLQILLKVATYERWGHRGLDDFWDGVARLATSDFTSVRETVAAIDSYRSTSSP